MAIPASMILFDDKKFVYLLLSPFAILNIIIVVIKANMKEIGVRKAMANGKGIKNITIAPKPAPAEIPRSPGSARLFRKSDCRIMPAQDNDEPTAIAFSILGNLISKIIFLLISFSDDPRLNNISGDMKLLPANNEIITDKISKINRKISIESLLDKSIISFQKFM